MATTQLAWLDWSGNKHLIADPSDLSEVPSLATIVPVSPEEM